MAESIELDLPRDVREKLEAANKAVLDALMAFRRSSDPLAASYFGLTAEQFEMLGSLSHMDVLKITRVGLPIFTLRFQDAISAGNGVKFDREKVVRSVLDSFGPILDQR